MNIKSLNNATILQKYVLIFIAFLLTAALLLFGLIRPNLAKIKYVRGEIITQKKNSEDIVKNEINANRLSEKFDIIEPELEKFNQIFINRNRELEFITTLENTASQENINQKINFNLVPGASEQIYQMVPLEISAQGEYEKILSYLNALENLTYYLNINTLEFSTGAAVFTPASPTDGASGGKTINLRITANTYWR
ncbi:MAG: type 4a pilus biogenesis protein PilO [Planctomycetes bacterium]|jgi:Tfp pilus assembly protein PilO|nr:type 4a pilus biogenesis protein PilO [Planctomycetota bacterium]